MDLEQLQKEKQDLEQQLLERNKVRILSPQPFTSLPFPVLVPETTPSLRRVLLALLGTSWGRYSFRTRALSWFSSSVSLLRFRVLSHAPSSPLPPT